MQRCAPELLLEWKKSEKSSYLHHDTQNEIIRLMTFIILRDIAKSINKSIFYLIMADEVADNFWLQISINWFIPKLVVKQQSYQVRMLFIDLALTVYLMWQSTLNRAYSNDIFFWIFCSIPSLLEDLLIRLEVSSYVVSIPDTVFQNPYIFHYISNS